MSIKLKFSILISIFIIFLVSVLTYFSISRQERSLLESTDKRIKNSLINAGDTIKEGLISSDDLLIASTITKMKNRDEDIINSYILDKNGNLIYHSDKAIMNDVLTLGIIKKYNDPINKSALDSKDFIKIKQKDFYLYAYPLFDNNIRMGTILVQFNFNKILKDIQLSARKFLIISFIILMIFIFVTYFFTSFLLKPLKLLAEGAILIGKGNLDHKIIITQKDELGELALGFNKMTNELKVSRQKIIDKELMEKDLEIASEIQQFLIPKEIPIIEKISFDAFYKPARFVGGDYFDVLEIGKDKYGIIIIDVSGKGSGAAIIMAVISFIFHSEAMKTYDTSELMYQLNNKLIDRIPLGRFATGIYLIYDAKQEVIQFTNAGHSNLIYYQNSHEKVMEIDKAAALPIGIAKDVKYERFAFKLSKNDAILLSTDGIYEAMDENRNEFTLEEVKKYFFNISKQSNDPNFINKEIISAIQKFVGQAKQHDDMTLITIKKT